MIEVNYENGFKIINEYPDYTPQEKEQADRNLMLKLHDVIFNDKISIDT